MMRTRLFSEARQWKASQSGVAATEFALVFPFLLLFLMGVYDFGQAFVINQKTITASQIMADLTARNVAVSQDLIEDVIDAGSQAMRPYSLQPYGYDIISLSYEPGEDDGEYETVVCWRRTANMEESDLPIDNAEPLAEPGEGLVIVTVGYEYKPAFGARIMNNIIMRERAFARGRRTPVVSFQNGTDIGCEA